MEYKSLTHDGKLIVYKESFWIGKREILIDGTPIKKMDKKSYYYDDKAYTLKGSYLFGARLERGAERIILVPNLTALEWVFVILPLILLFIGGVIGGFCAVAAALMFVSISRAINNNLVKIVLGLATTAGAFFLWFMASLIVAALTAPVA